MKVKICNLLRATTYTQLLAATLALGWLGYNAIMQPVFISEMNFREAIIIAAMLQSILAIAVIRLMYHYAPGHQIPDASFLRFYKILVGMNIVIDTSVLMWFSVQSILLLQQLRQFGIFDPQRSLQLCTIGSYSVVAIYTIAGAAKLKRAILQRKEWQIENWLNEIRHLEAA